MISSAGKLHRPHAATSCLLIARLTMVAMGLSHPSQADATSPGKNGRLLLDLRQGKYASVLADDRDFIYEWFSRYMTRHQFPRWTADGKNLLVSGDYYHPSDQYGDLSHSSGVFSAPASGAEPTLLWEGPSGAKVVTLPDGRFLAFAYSDMLYPRDDPDPRPDPANGIYVRDLENGITNKISLAPSLFVEEVIFSPDGRRITYLARPGVNSEALSKTVIDSLKIDGTSRREVAHLDQWAADLSYSPDGRRLSFRRASGISTIGINGSGMKRVTGDPNDSGPIFSPDGRMIAFSREVPLGSGKPGVWVVNTDGSAPRPIRSGPGEERVLDWGVAAPFVFRGYVRRKGLVRARVFGPGKLTVSGPALRSVSRSSKGTQVLKVPLTLKRGVRIAANAKVKVKLRFSPKGGMPSLIEKKVRLGGR